MNYLSRYPQCCVWWTVSQHCCHVFSGGRSSATQKCCSHLQPCWGKAFLEFWICISYVVDSCLTRPLKALFKAEDIVASLKIYMLCICGHKWGTNQVLTFFEGMVKQTVCGNEGDSEAPALWMFVGREEGGGGPLTLSITGTCTRLCKQFLKCNIKLITFFILLFYLYMYFLIIKHCTSYPGSKLLTSVYSILKYTKMFEIFFCSM